MLSAPQKSSYMSNSIVLLLGISALIGLVLFFAWRNRQRMRPYYERLERLSRDLTGTISKSQRFFYDVPCFIGNFSGQKFSLTYWHDEGSPPRYLRLKCYIPSLSDLKIYAYPNPTTVFFAKRVELLDEPFDKHFIYSNRPDEARLFLTNESRKKTIRKLIDDGWSFPHITKQAISLHANADHGLDPAGLRSTLTQIMELRT